MPYGQDYSTLLLFLSSLVRDIRVLRVDLADWQIRSRSL